MAVTPSQIELEKPDSLREFGENIPHLCEAPPLAPDYEIDDLKNPKQKTTAEINNEAASGFHEGGHAYHINHVNNESAEGALKGNEAEEAKNRRARVIINQVNGQIYLINQQINCWELKLDKLTDTEKQLARKQAEQKVLIGDQKKIVNGIEHSANYVEEALEEIDDKTDALERAMEHPHLGLDTEHGRQAARELADAQRELDEVLEKHGSVEVLQHRQELLRGLIAQERLDLSEYEEGLRRLDIALKDNLKEQQLVNSRLQELHERGAAVIAVSEDPELAEKVSNGMSLEEAVNEVRQSEVFQNNLDQRINDFQSYSGELGEAYASELTEVRTSIGDKETEINNLLAKQKEYSEVKDKVTDPKFVEAIKNGEITKGQAISSLPESMREEAYKMLEEKFAELTGKSSQPENMSVARPETNMTPLPKGTDLSEMRFQADVAVTESTGLDGQSPINPAFSGVAQQMQTQTFGQTQPGQNMTRFDPDKLSQNLQQLGMSRSASLTPGS